MELMISDNKTVELVLTGKTSERKLSAVERADHVGVIVISGGTGAAAKKAREFRAEHDKENTARAIGAGNFHAFAAAWAAATGESVRFGARDVYGNVVRSAKADFIAFATVIDHTIAQLEGRGKYLTAKGTYTSAYSELLRLRALHKRSVEWAERIKVEALARKAIATEIKAEAEVKAETKVKAETEVKAEAEVKAVQRRTNKKNRAAVAAEEPVVA